MLPDHTVIPDLTISPLTFRHTYESAAALMAAMLEQDAMFQRRLGRSGTLRLLMRIWAFPLYYHWMTSGYGAFVGEDLVGWLYLRGWKQVLYVETLATHPAWRRRGIASALLGFAEQQARELRRHWLGLTVTVENTAAVRLYEKQGYCRTHWRILRCDGENPIPRMGNQDFRLRPVFGLAAEWDYRRFTNLDLAAGEEWVAPILSRFLGFEPHRQLLGQDWLIEVDNQSVAYLHKHGPRRHPTLYLSCGPEWWADPRLIQAVGKVIGQETLQRQVVDLRLGSSGHHDAALSGLSTMGFTEHPASTTKMFKHLADSIAPGEPQARKQGQP